MSNKTLYQLLQTCVSANVDSQQKLNVCQIWIECIDRGIQNENQKANTRKFSNI